MKFFNYILRNARRNPVRSLLTIASMAISLFLMMILVSFFSMRNDILSSMGDYNRLITASSQGFTGKVPITLVREIAALDGVTATSPFLFYDGRYREQSRAFAQLGIDPETFFTIYNELSIKPSHLRAFCEDKAGCVIGRKLAEDRGLKIGDPLALKGDSHPFDLDLTIRGIYDGPSNRNLRWCLFHWEYLDDGLKRDQQGQMSGNAGMIFTKCRNGDVLTSLSKKIDALSSNSETPTMTQTDEAFGKMYSGFLGDLQRLIQQIGLAVVFSLLCVAGNSMAMSLRERTTEVAVLKAIGFSRPLIVFLVLTEAILVAGLGGILGVLGCKLLCDVVDVTRFAGGFLPLFYIPWSTAIQGMGVSLFVGFFSGFFPAIRAAQLSVVNGLRKVA